jgi:hypothetical protein
MLSLVSLTACSIIDIHTHKAAYIRTRTGSKRLRVESMRQLLIISQTHMHWHAHQTLTREQQDVASPWDSRLHVHVLLVACACVHVCMYACLYISMFVRTYVAYWKHTHPHVWVCACVYLRNGQHPGATYIYSPHMHAYVHKEATCMHAYVHLHTYKRNNNALAWCISSVRTCTSFGAWAHLIIKSSRWQHTWSSSHQDDSTRDHQVIKMTAHVTIKSSRWQHTWPSSHQDDSTRDYQVIKMTAHVTIKSSRWQHTWRSSHQDDSTRDHQVIKMTAHVIIKSAWTAAWHGSTHIQVLEHFSVRARVSVCMSCVWGLCSG